MLLSRTCLIVLGDEEACSVVIVDGNGSNHEISVVVWLEVSAGVVDRLQCVVAAVERVCVQDERRIYIELLRVGRVVGRLTTQIEPEVTNVPGGTTGIDHRVALRSQSLVDLGPRTAADQKEQERVVNICRQKQFVCHGQFHSCAGFVVHRYCNNNKNNRVIIIIIVTIQSFL